MAINLRTVMHDIAEIGDATIEYAEGDAHVTIMGKTVQAADVRDVINVLTQLAGKLGV